MVEIVLTQNIATLGNKGQIKMVRPGYFRNYLYPMGLALKANAQSKIDAEMYAKKAIMRKEQVAINANSIAQSLKGLVLSFKERTNNKGHLYGSVTEKDIADKIKEEANVEIDASHVKLSAHLKELGEYNVDLELNEDVSVSIKVKIEKE